MFAGLAYGWVCLALWMKGGLYGLARFLFRDSLSSRVPGCTSQLPGCISQHAGCTSHGLRCNFSYAWVASCLGGGRSRVGRVLVRSLGRGGVMVGRWPAGCAGWRGGVRGCSTLIKDVEVGPDRQVVAVAPLVLHAVIGAEGLPAAVFLVRSQQKVGRKDVSSAGVAGRVGAE